VIFDHHQLYNVFASFKCGSADVVCVVYVRVFLVTNQSVRNLAAAHCLPMYVLYDLHSKSQRWVQVVFHKPGINLVYSRVYARVDSPLARSRAY